MQDPTAASDLSRKSFVIVAVYGAVLYFAALGGNRVLTLHEALFAQAAKEINASGNWITTTYGGAYFNHKPPLTYWLMAALFSITGNQSEWLIRAPFALASIATALLIAKLAARRHGDWVGLLTGLIQLTSFYMVMQGRLAESDILLCLFVTLALVAFAFARIAELSTGEYSRRVQLGWALLFQIGAGLAFMTKGPIGLVFAFFPAITWDLLQRHWSAWRFYLSPLPLMALLLLVLGWPYFAWRADPNIFETWRYHNLGRFMGEMGGRKPPLFYMYTLPYMLLPWTPCLLVGIWIGCKRGLLRDPVWRLLGLAFTCGFAVLSAAVWQYKHYLVPILPPLSILSAFGLAWMLEGIRAFAMRQATALEVPRAPSPIAWKRASVLFAVCAIAILTIEVAAMPYFDSYRDQTNFARIVNQKTPEQQCLFLVALPENQITFYLRMPVQRVDDPRDFVDAVAPRFDGKPVYVVGPESVQSTLAKAGTVERVQACPTIRAIMNPEDRITLFRITANRVASRNTPENVR